MKTLVTCVLTLSLGFLVAAGCSRPAQQEQPAQPGVKQQTLPVKVESGSAPAEKKPMEKAAEKPMEKPAEKPK